MLNFDLRVEDKEGGKSLCCWEDLSQEYIG